MIQAQDLTFTYPGKEKETLHGISFCIEKGEIYGFLGPSGAGKSTTQKILTRLISGYGGSVTVMGKTLGKWGNAYFNHIGVGFELPNHYPKLSGLENLQLFASLYDKPSCNLKSLLSRVGLQDAALEKTSDYSKGMKMRLNFARALIHDPEVLFFDEPTSGLDPVNAKNMKDMIQELKAQGKTIFLTTHNMYDADELCDRVAFIHDGQIMAEDTPRHLKRKYGKPTLTVEFMDGQLTSRDFNLGSLGENKDFHAIIRNKEIMSMHSREASLNDVFVKITGKKLVTNH